MVCKLMRMNRANPEIDNKEVVAAIKERLPSIIWVYALFVLIQTGFFLLYTTERSINFISKADPDSFDSFEIKPSVQIA